MYVQVLDEESNMSRIFVAFIAGIWNKGHDFVRVPCPYSYKNTTTFPEKDWQGWFNTKLSPHMLHKSHVLKAQTFINVTKCHTEPSTISNFTETSKNWDKTDGMLT